MCENQTGTYKSNRKIVVLGDSIQIQVDKTWILYPDSFFLYFRRETTYPELIPKILDLRNKGISPQGHGFATLSATSH